MHIDIASKCTLSKVIGTCVPLGCSHSCGGYDHCIEKKHEQHHTVRTVIVHKVTSCSSLAVEIISFKSSWYAMSRKKISTSLPSQTTARAFVKTEHLTSFLLGVFQTVPYLGSNLRTFEKMDSQLKRKCDLRGR